MYNSTDFNKNALPLPKKDILSFLENNLNDFITNKAFKEDNKKILDQQWIKILENLITVIQTSNKRKFKCFLNTTSIRILVRELAQ